jgi:hypothetical protein
MSVVSISGLCRKGRNPMSGVYEQGCHLAAVLTTSAPEWVYSVFPVRLYLYPFGVDRGRENALHLFPDGHSLRFLCYWP